MDNSSRINDKIISLSDESVQDFWNGRGEKKLPHRYNMVNFQDDDPEKAIVRDQIEKERITRFFQISPHDHILDIGCGVGRWGDYILPILNDGMYIGIDYSESLIQMSKSHFSNYESARFLVGSFQNLTDVLSTDSPIQTFDKVLINGVLVYINDDDVYSCLAQADRALKNGGFIYFKESVGITRRLTLKDYYSDSLESKYNAIYRTLNQYTKITSDSFISHNYTLIACGPVWMDKINYSQETTSWFWILRKDES